jgi:predicted nucleic-acid-binding protein
MATATVFQLESEGAVRTALLAARSHKGSFTDHLMAQIGLANGCTSTAAFDVDLRTVPGFRRL